MKGRKQRQGVDEQRRREEYKGTRRWIGGDEEMKTEREEKETRMRRWRRRGEGKGQDTRR